MNTRDNIPVRIDVDKADDSNANKVRGQSAAQKSFRIVCVTVANSSAAVVEGTLKCPQVPSWKRSVKVGATDSVKYFLYIEDYPKTTSVQFDLYDYHSEVVAAASSMLSGKALAGPRYEVSPISLELDQEQQTRQSFKRVLASIKSIAGAKLTLIHKETGMIVESATGNDGVWNGTLLEGKWQVLVRHVVFPKIEQDRTEATTPVRAYYLQGTFSGGELQLNPEQSTLLNLTDEDGRIVKPDRISLTPVQFAEFLRYETIYAAAAGKICLNFQAGQHRGIPIEICTNNLEALEILAFESPGTVVAGRKFVISLQRNSVARLKFDASVCGAESLDVRFSLPEYPREVFSLMCDRANPKTIVVPAGPVRVEMSVKMAGGIVYHFAPQLIGAKGGFEIDMTPKGIAPQIYYQETQGLMLWVALVDSQGKVVSRIDGLKKEVPAFTVSCTYRGKELFKKSLESLTFHFASEFNGIPPKEMVFAVDYDFDGHISKTGLKAQLRQTFLESVGEVVAPACLKAKAEQMLPAINKTLEAGQKIFGFPRTNLKVNFEIRLPPEVGGMGGGGMMLLDLYELINFAHETDRMPGAYAHELGHNLGFGHDPYMMMAPCVVDEGIGGAEGYFLQHGPAVSRAFGYLDRVEDKGEWSPSADVFAALRTIYGADVHKKMFSVRARVERRFDNTGISISEKIAAYYSCSLKQNVAWIFRAYGWPVFDYRVKLACDIVGDASLAQDQKLPKEIDGTIMNAWWVRGPIAQNGKIDWKFHQWQGKFLQLATEQTFLKEETYHFYESIYSKTDQYCLLSIASDVQVDFFVNGKRVIHVAAAPQFSQPVHEGYTLENANATVVPIVLAEGDNAVEMVVVKTAGSRGIYVQLAGSSGGEVGGILLKHDDGPGEKKLSDAEKVTHEIGCPLFNGSFESGEKLPDSWIAGAKEGDGKLRIEFDSGIQPNSRAVKLSADGPLSASIIQRLVLQEKSTYNITAWVKSDGLKQKVDKAYLCIFTGDPNAEPIVKTAVIEKPVRDWTKISFKYTANRRCVYFGIVLKSSGGGVFWVDNIEFSK